MLGGGHRVHDVCPLHLGVGVVKRADGSDFSVMIPRNSGVPSQRREEYCTANDNQTALTIRVYQGEHPTLISHNTEIASVELKGLPPRKAGGVTAMVTFKLDANSMLDVEAYITDNVANRGSVKVGTDIARVRGSQSEAITKSAGGWHDSGAASGGEKATGAGCAPEVQDQVYGSRYYIAIRSPCLYLTVCHQRPRSRRLCLLETRPSLKPKSCSRLYAPPVLKSRQHAAAPTLRRRRRS